MCFAREKSTILRSPITTAKSMNSNTKFFGEYGFWISRFTKLALNIFFAILALIILFVEKPARFPYKHKTLFGRNGRQMDVKTTSCAYWVWIRKSSLMMRAKNPIRSFPYSNLKPRQTYRRKNTNSAIY